MKLGCAGLIFLCAWHFLGVKATESAFTEVDPETGKTIFLNPQDVKKEVRKKYAQMPTLVDRLRSDDPVYKRDPIEIMKVKFDLDSE